MLTLQIKGHKEASILAETALGNIYIRTRELPEVKVIFHLFSCPIKPS